MNAENAVPKRMRCSHCQALYTTGRVGDSCNRVIPTKSMGDVPCPGHVVITNGQKFKDLHGFSKTLHRNMRKHGLDINQFSDSVNAYKDIRRKRKKKELLAKRAKQSTKRAGRRAPKEKRGSA